MVRCFFLPLPPPLFPSDNRGDGLHTCISDPKTCQNLKGLDPITIGPPYKATERDNRSRQHIARGMYTVHVLSLFYLPQVPIVLCPRHNHTLARQDRVPSL